jgi:hypothetical protein
MNKYIMKFDQYFENWNPSLNKEVNDYVERNKNGLSELWDKELSEDENIELMINYFKKYPDQMKSKNYNFYLPSKKDDFRNNSPTLQNIGGIHPF